MKKTSFEYNRFIFLNISHSNNNIEGGFQLSAKCPQLPALLIGQIETLKIRWLKDRQQLLRPVLVRSQLLRTTISITVYLKIYFFLISFEQGYLVYSMHIFEIWNTYS